MDKNKPLFGLVVCGGQSSRMGTDKCMLTYHDKPQAFHLFTMLQKVCGKVYISCNKAQTNLFPSTIPVLTDMDLYKHIGPMAALLSSFSIYPDTDLLVIGCDYPFFTETDLKQIVKAVKKEDLAVSFFNPDTGFSEPLLTYYSAACYPLLKDSYNKSNYSLQAFLKEIKTKRIVPETLKSIISVDTPENYKIALQKLEISTK